jgi:type IV pilus assembly protein PilA
MFSANHRPDGWAGKGKGFSLIELLIVIAVILVIASIAIPNLMRARLAANQAAAAENVRTINTAAAAYSATYNLGFPPTFLSMGGSTGNPATCTAAILIDEVLSTPPHWKSGYIYDYEPEGPAETIAVPPGCVDGYYDYLITAAPVTVGSTGQNSFCADEPGVIHFDSTGNPAASTAACDALPPLQ